MHSGTGRIVKIKMRPMSLYESGDSTGEISLNELFYNSNYKIRGTSPTGVRDLASYIVRGGFPAALGKTEKEYITIMKGYYNSLISEDIVNIDGIKREPSKMNALLRSYSRNISTTVSNSTIKKDIENEGITIDEKTFLDYKNTLEKLYIIENVPARPTNIRSKTAIRKSDRKEIVDTGIACASLVLTSDIILNDLNYLGFLFESLCVRDLRIYAESIDGKLFHYREEKGFEIDSIIELRNGKWGGN